MSVLVHQPPRRLALIVMKMAGHISHNEGKIEHHDRILKHLEKNMKLLEEQKNKYVRLIRHYEQQIKALEISASKERADPRKHGHTVAQANHLRAAVANLEKHAMGMEGRIRALASVFQNHMLQKTGLEQQELHYISTSKICLDIIERRKVTATSHDAHIVSDAAGKHELTRSQKKTLINNLEHVHKKAHILARHEWDVRRAVNRGLH